MSNFPTSVWFILISIIPKAILDDKLNNVCQRDQNCGLNQVCQYGRCQCAINTFLWHGSKCLKTGIGYGDICSDQSECSYSGDPHLHCKSTNHGFRCLCRDGFHVTENGSCSRIFVKLNKMQPKATEVRVLSDHGSK